MFRLLLAPVLVSLLLPQTSAASWVAAALFVAGAMTDGLDGYLARRHASTSRTGQWLDPLADKLLVAAPVLTLTATGRFPAWAAVVILVREAVIAALRVVLGYRGVPLPASTGAKVKTVLQILAISLYILPLSDIPAALRTVALVLATAVTVLTGADYLLRASGVVRGAGARRTL